MDQKKIGLFLKELRKERNLTQQQVSEYFNVSDRTISRWENGINMPDISMLVYIADFYNIDVRELLNGERNIEESLENINETLLKVSEYQNVKKKNVYIKVLICIVLLLICMNAFLIHHKQINQDMRIDIYHGEQIKKEMISDDYLSDDIKISLMNKINNHDDYAIIRDDIIVNKQYTCAVYFYVSLVKDSMDIDYILCGTIDMNGKKFDGNLYYYLEDSKSIFYDINGNFSNLGDISISSENDAKSGIMTYKNSLYYTINEFAYCHKSGIIRY